jgi:hypothetical protein
MLAGKQISEKHEAQNETLTERIYNIPTCSCKVIYRGESPGYVSSLRFRFSLFDYSVGITYVK